MRIDHSMNHIIEIDHFGNQDPFDLQITIHELNHAHRNISPAMIGGNAYFPSDFCRPTILCTAFCR